MRHAVIARIGPPQAMYAAQRDPRAFQAWQSAALSAMRATHIPREADENILFDREFRFPAHRPPKVHTDWSINLGGQGTAAAMFPAKFSFDVNATPNCTEDFAVFPVNQSPNATHENLVAFNNLYSGTVPANGICNRAPSGSDTGTSATVVWSYAILSSDNAGVQTSPALSLDGKKVAFVTSKGAQQPRFHVLAWKSGDGVNSSNLQDAQNSTKVISTFSSTAPAAGSGEVTDLAFGASSGGPGDTLSSPFIDYPNDKAYVGDDKANLVRIKNVFCTLSSCAGAAPSIDTSWGSSGTVTVGSGSCAGTGQSQLTGPVADLITGNVFVGCADGKLYGFNSSGTALAASPVTVGNNSATGGLQDPPIVDGINGFVYAFAGNNSGSNAIAAQAKTDLSSPVLVVVGPGNTFNLHAGAFNDAYFSNPSSSTWLLYLMAYNGGSTHTFFYWIGFGAGHVMNSAFTGKVNTPQTASECSPLTEFLNGATDQLFFGQQQANVVQAYNINSSTPSQITGSPVTEQGGTSGIVVDNVSTSAQASSIYFATLNNQACGAGPTGNLNGRCATKLTQSGLK